MNTTVILIAVLLLGPIRFSAFAHGGGKHVKLHVNPRWKECSLQIDPSLTQHAWREFTREAGLVAYFRPLTDARPMRAGNFEISALQWGTALDDTKDAWNDTFVHPDSTHWLKDGSRLAFPGITVRAGITDALDAGAYFTKNPGSNYGFWGGQVQYNVVNDAESRWAASARVGFVALYGPEDLNLTVYGLDLLASKEFVVHSDWISVSPYASISTYLSASHETTDAVDLKDERVAGVQGAVGVVAHVALVRLAAEYNIAAVNTLSFKVGVGF